MPQASSSTFGNNDRLPFQTAQYEVASNAQDEVVAAGLAAFSRIGAGFTADSVAVFPL